ncbi:flagellin [Cryobacterium psychrotolerans]|uniref:Flagellin n=1 Tax=Cryobacterium psychrotolerans TaxID=386301 RepID=A0A1G8YBB3_9MICO|nr:MULTISPECIES: flagellin [Cryobacterium]TFD49317.1 flagellin [Cryobacterium sp. TMT1-2-1]TFD90915.1 flagellin [Cryobacterium psychrotolerans]SDJ99704.1 flagellin [Cryobacterium psychrotolerans]
MGMQVNTNLAANNSYRNLAATQNDMSKSLEKLSSGLRINRAADDAAGLAISEGLKSQVGGLTVASRNAQDGISVLQTAEGSLNEVQSILQRVRDLAVQAGNDSNNADSRSAIKTEVDSLTKELTRIGESTNFNGTKLLDGTSTSLSFQVGANSDASSQIVVNLSGANVKGIATALTGAASGATGSAFAIADITALTVGAATFTSTTAAGVTTSVTTATLSDAVGGAGFQSVDEYATALGADANFAANFSVSVTRDGNGAGTGITVQALNGGVVSTAVAPAAGVALGGAAGTAPAGVGLDFTSAAGAAAAITSIDAQIKNVSTARAELGAVQNRFESVIKNLAVSKENLTAAGSRIRDTDMAEEMVKFTRSNILTQAGTAMLAQANQSNQGVLQLLR